MRRVLGVVLAALAAVLLLTALLLPTFVAPRLLQAPLDQYSRTVSEAENATYLDVGELEVKQGRTLVATRTVRGDVEAGSRSTAVYDVLVFIADPAKPGTGEDQLVSASTDRVAFERHTSEAVNCCDENLNGDPVEHEGIEYKFPFRTEQRTYQYFDTSIGEATDMEFQAEEEIDGLNTYRFQQVIDPRKIAELDVPGSLVGSDEQSLTLGRYYSVTRTVWVEPASGVIVRGQEQQLSTLRDDSGFDLLTITEADLTFNDETVSAQVEVAQDARSQVVLVSQTLPLAAGGVGLVLLGLAVVLSRMSAAPTAGRRRADRTDRTDTDEHTPV